MIFFWTKQLSKTSFILLPTIFFIYSFAHSTDVTGDQTGTWTKAKSPYIIIGSVNVPVGSTLKIEPGVTIQSNSFSDAINVYGSLIAKGTSTDSIYFKGQTGSGANNYGGYLYFGSDSKDTLQYVSMSRWGDRNNFGDVGAIQINTASASISNSSIRNCEQTGIMMNSNGAVTNTSISNCGSVGINISSSIKPVLSNISFASTPKPVYAYPSSVGGISNCNNVVITLKSENIYSDFTISKPGTGSSYLLEDGFNIYTESKGIIRPGVTIQSNNYSDAINVYGSLIAKGTSTDSIYFKGQTGSGPNNYGGYLSFAPNSKDTLQYVSINRWGDIDYAGDVGAITINTSSASITNSSIRNSEQTGLFVYNSATITNTNISNCGNVAIDISASSIKPVLSNINFANTLRPVYAYPSSIGGISICNNIVITLKSENIYSEFTIPKPGAESLYLLEGGFTIYTDAKAIIKSGVTIQSNSYSDAIYIYGSLTAKGTSTDSIYFKGQTGSGANNYGGYLYFGADSKDTLQYISMNRWGDLDNNGDYGAIQINTTSASITSSSIRNSENIGIYINAPTIKPILSNLVFSGNAKPIYAYPTSVSGITNCNNTIITLKNEDIYSSFTLPKPGTASPYLLEGGFRIYSDSKGIIKPGVTIQSNSFSDVIYVYGSLIAKGTSTDSVYFKGQTGSGENNYGGYLYFGADSKDTLQYVNMNRWGDINNFGDVGAIQINTTSARITNSSIRNSESIGININAPAITPILSSLIFSGVPKPVSGYLSSVGSISNCNNINILLRNESIYSDVILSKPGSNSSYVLMNDISISAGNLLTIQSGVKVLFASADANLIVNGNFSARGNINDSIIFRGIKKYGNTTSYGGSIRLNGDSSALTFVSIDSLGANSSNNTALYIAGRSNVKYISVRNSQTSGIFITSSSVNISYSNLYKNLTGVSTQNCRPTLKNNNIYSNTSYGANNESLDSLVDASSSYWGNSSGPYHPVLNSTGTANKVSDSVKISSWKTSLVVPILPYISNFYPVAASTDTVITIKGLRFTGASNVSFGGVAAKSFTVVNDSIITAVVGTGNTGYVKIITSKGSDSLSGFTYCTGIKLHADFAYGTSFYEINTFNTSVDATGYAWSFGDGASSTDESPSHHYESIGTYTVCLRDTNVCAKKSETVCKIVTINGATITDDDKDGLYDLTEVAKYGTSTQKFDTNGDLLGDGPNVFTGLLVLSTDTDGDGVSNAQEILNGTSPILADTDFDGVNDKLDPFPLDRFRSKLPAKNSNDHVVPVITLIEPF